MHVARKQGWSRSNTVVRTSMEALSVEALGPNSSSHRGYVLRAAWNALKRVTSRVRRLSRDNIVPKCVLRGDVQTNLWINDRRLKQGS